MEIRRSVPPALRSGDVIFIVRKGEKGHIVGACRVTSVLKESVGELNKHIYEHRLVLSELEKYASGRGELFGIGLKRMELDTRCLYTRSFDYEFAPRWFYRIRPEYMSTIERVLKTTKSE